MPTICLIPGDGVGQEVIPAAARVLATVAPDLEFVEAKAGWACYERHGTALPEATLAAVANADGTLFGATQSPMGSEAQPFPHPHPHPNPPPRRGREPDSLPLRGGGLGWGWDSLPLRGGGPGRGSDSSPQPPSTTTSPYRSPILALRKHFDLYANLRPTKTMLPGQQAVDLLIVRENTEGLYAGRERRDGDTAIAERVITRRASQRIARVAFEQARLRAAGGKLQVAGGKSPQSLTSPIYQSTNLPTHQPTVTIVHKANVLKLTDGLFRETCLEVARDYPDIAVNEMLVDTAAMWLVEDPARFDVIVTTNLFGDILSDLAAGLVGGLGVAPSANVGAGRVAVFEPVHGSAPDIAGRGVANPVGAILSAAMLLEHLGRAEAAARVRRAVAQTLACGIMPPDLGGAASTDEVTAAIISQVDGPV